MGDIKKDLKINAICKIEQMNTAIRDYFVKGIFVGFDIIAFVYFQLR